MAGYSPSASPSRMGKRHIVQFQDSISEPPRKSPASIQTLGGSCSPVRKFDFNPCNVPELDEARQENELPESRQANWNTENDLLNFKLDRPIKRALRHRSRSPSPSGIACETVSRRTLQGQITPDSRGEGEAYQTSGPEESPIRSHGKGLDVCGAPCRILCQKSKDILDEYFAQRRRSSCKDITFHFMRADTSADDSTYPVFSEVQYKRLDTMEEESAPQGMRFDPVTTGLLPGGGTPLLRSLSADGYSSQDQKERRDDTQALLFESTPDLADDQLYLRFSSVRNRRRGAVCYDSEPLMLLLKDLHVEDS